MKILIVTTTVGTINSFLIPHIKFLIDKGYKVDVASNINKDISEIKRLGCNVYNIEFQRSPIRKENFRALIKIKDLVLGEKYELIHTHTPVASLITRIACKDIPNIKILYTAHGFHFLKGASLQNWLFYYPMEKIAARWTDGLITINEEDYLAARKMKLRNSNAVFKVSGVGVNLEKFTPVSKELKSKLRKEYLYNKDDFILMYAATLNENKHQDLLINTVNLLKNEIPNVKLLLAGEGPMKEHYEMQIKNLGLQDNIILLGVRKDIANLLRISDVAVASSRREGLPVNIMEAMATGLPLVVTDRRGHHDLISDNENGYLIGIDDIEGFAKSIIKLFKSKELRSSFGERNLELVKSYKVENVLKEMEGIYSAYITKGL